MHHHSRVLESPLSNGSSSSSRRSVDEPVLEAIEILNRTIERRTPGLDLVPEFKQLAISIPTVYPSLKDRRLECEQCGEMFGSVDDKLKHASIHRSANKGHNCPICQKIFNSSQNLQAHKSRDHSSLSDIKFCPFCELEVLESIHLHNKTNHPHACFACKADLQSLREKALHDGALHNRKFICHTCWRTFIEKNHLIQHQTDSHTVYCRTCTPQKSFSSGAALEAHYTAKHSRPY